jgi:hypothetical protein
VNIFFRVARREKEQYLPRWMIQRRRLPDGWIVAIRLGRHNNSILDYLLVPTIDTDKDTIRFTEKNCGPLGIDRFETSEGLARSISRRVTRPSRVSPTKPQPPKKKLRSSQSKGVIGRERR